MTVGQRNNQKERDMAVDWSEFEGPLDRAKRRSEQLMKDYRMYNPRFHKFGPERQSHYRAVQQRASFRIIDGNAKVPPGSKSESNL